jgi:hypothetical protein
MGTMMKQFHWIVVQMQGFVSVALSIYDDKRKTGIEEAV